MNFFAQANLLTADSTFPSAAALACANGKAFLTWGDHDPESKISVTPFPFHKNHATQTLKLKNSLVHEIKDFRKFPRIPPPTSKDFPNEWNHYCQKIAAGIDVGNFSKIVPARFREYNINSDTRNFILTNLFERLCSMAAPNTYKFFIQMDQSIFFGATPELLFRRAGGSLFVPAIAGTKLKSSDNSAKELFESKKDREEHKIVVDGIVENLLSLGLKPTCPNEPVVKEFGSLIHLFTPIQCKNAQAIPHAQLIGALHPTPAIGGFPQKQAQKFILENEGWDRGFFSSPIYFSLPEEEICLVAIRSAQLTMNSLRFYAGAGFVRTSTSAGEWAETEKKMDSLASIFFEGL